ncbi:MAG: indole-3-glycerol-phosphate synthase [Lentisphaerales bacterium]|nr:MAG: indole-3-glycerol-phosphate synthase [Lentisphaerales bacterium]
MATAYTECGAAGISVLTEPNRFLGRPDDLRLTRENSSLPILRKDFMVDVYQMYEAAAWGADAVLLIAAALDPDRLLDLYAKASSLSLEVIVEVHSEAELPVALECSNAILGVNSRDLTSMQTDLSVAFRIRQSIPSGRLTLAESGIRSRHDIVALRAAGYDAFLVGEILMRSPSPGARLRELTGAGPE